MSGNTEALRGIYGKYIIGKTDGTPVDPDAVYFVLRLDNNLAGRAAVLEYARHCRDTKLKEDIRSLVTRLRKEDQ